jgi:crotonobetainyl-CoA:carnitine CoA-transferase CaiB-like acyl-CoA transferase
MLAAEISRIIETQPRQYWLATCRAAGATIAERFVLEDVLRDSAARAAGILSQHLDPSVGLIEHCGVADVDASPMPKRGGVPITELGGHGRELLSEFGYSSDAVALLLSAGAVEIPPPSSNFTDDSIERKR